MLKTIPLFVLVITLIESGLCRNIKRTYIIEKDHFGGFKGHGYTIYDSKGKTQLYRMEPQFNWIFNMRLYRGLNSNDPIAFLEMKSFTFTYKATIQIRNQMTDRWIDGTIKHSFHMFTTKLTIKYNQHDIIMKDGIFSWDTTFVDASNQQVLAQFHKKISIFGPKQYQLEVFSDEFPDELYFLVFFARGQMKDIKRLKAEAAKKEKLRL